MTDILHEAGDMCSVCNIYYPYEDLYVIDTEPSDDYYDIREIYICKYCKEESK